MHAFYEIKMVNQNAFWARRFAFISKRATPFRTKCRKSLGDICHARSFRVFEDNSIAEHTDRPGSMESIRFQTSTPSSGTDSIVDTSVIIFAFLSLGKFVAVLINVLHNSAISRGEYFRCDVPCHGISVCRR